MTSPTFPLWDQHACPTLEHGASLAALASYPRPGPTTVGLNVGYSPHDQASVRKLIDAFCAGIEKMPDIALATTNARLDEAHERGDIAVFFDLEDSGPLDGDAGNLVELASRGVRSILTTYNRENAAGSGCLDTVDRGLSKFGRNVVRTANREGVIVDASHVSVLASREMFRISTSPVIFSHTGMHGIWSSARNISDDQARACADTGGVIGIYGIGPFIGPNDAGVDVVVRHIEYALDLVGPEHVGIGSDYSFDLDAVNEALTTMPDDFPPEVSQYPTVEMMAPADLGTVADALLQRGHSRDDVAKISGLNFRRVARAVWPD